MRKAVLRRAREADPRGGQMHRKFAPSQARLEPRPNIASVAENIRPFIMLRTVLASGDGGTLARLRPPFK